MATKEKSVFFCKNCGNESPKWFGKCPACGEWNTCVEEKEVRSKKQEDRRQKTEVVPMPIKEITNAEE